MGFEPFLRRAAVFGVLLHERGHVALVFGVLRIGEVSVETLRRVFDVVLALLLGATLQRHDAAVAAHMPAMPEPATTTSAVMSHLRGVFRRPGVGAAKADGRKPAKPVAAASALQDMGGSRNVSRAAGRSSDEEANELQTGKDGDEALQVGKMTDVDAMGIHVNLLTGLFHRVIDGLVCRFAERQVLQLNKVGNLGRTAFCRQRDDVDETGVFAANLDLGEKFVRIRQAEGCDNERLDVGFVELCVVMHAA